MGGGQNEVGLRERFRSSFMEDCVAVIVSRDTEGCDGVVNFFFFPLGTRHVREWEVTVKGFEWSAEYHRISSLLTTHGP